MTPNDILPWTRRQPFTPFRIRLNGGRTFEIRHPETVIVGFTTINIYTFAKEPADVYEKLEMVSMMLIESIEPIAVPQAA